MKRDCCSSFFNKRELSSPFDKLISSSYYDGTTSGVTMCRICNAEYFYEMLSWDENQDIRIFGISAVTQGTFANLIELCSRFDNARWTEWQPNVDTASALDAKQFRTKVENLCATRSPLAFIVVSQELSKTIMLARRIRNVNDIENESLHKSLDLAMYHKWLKFLEVG